MTRFRALFLCEGTSDSALGEVVARLLLRRGAPVLLTAPDFSRLADPSKKDLVSRLGTALELMGPVVPDVLVIHRDADGAGRDQRLEEMTSAIREHGVGCELVPVIPTRMTEAWLLLNSGAIRAAAGNPSGRMPLALPSPAEVERRADPKTVLKESLLEASGARVGAESVSRDCSRPSEGNCWSSWTWRARSTACPPGSSW